VILVAGLDAEQEVPILHLRLRKAAAAGARIFVLHPRRTRMWDVAEHILCRPGDEAWLLDREEGRHRSEIASAVTALTDAGEEGIVIAGPRLADHPQAVYRARSLAAETRAPFAYVTRRANDRGALVTGIHPRLLPGGRLSGIAEERAEVESVWGALDVDDQGRDWHAILEASANREIDVLFLIGVDPLRDYPDAALARRALDNVPRKVVQSLELGSLARFADAFLPAAAFLEKDGHVTTWEGRGQRLHRIRDPVGMSRPDWEIFASLALACGGDLGFETLDELHAEMGSLLAPREPRERMIGDAGAPPARVGDDEVLLFTYPLLVDDGRLSERADELEAALADPPFAEIHPADAARAGVADGAAVRLNTAAGEATLPARVTEHVAEGAVFVPFNQAGFAANALLQGRFSIAATIESVDAPADDDPVEVGAGGSD
jgi:NADH-quinone oxidoreductase subunit G